MFLCVEDLLDCFVATGGSILESFWGHLELIFCVFSKMFGDVFELFERCSGVVSFHWPAVFITENVEENEKGKGKEKKSVPSIGASFSLL